MANKKKTKNKKTAKIKTKPAKKTSAKPAKKKIVAKKTAKKKNLTKTAQATKKKVVKKAMTPKVSAKKSPAPSVVSSQVKAKSIDYSKAVTPLADRLVVRPLGGERVTAGGLIIPDTAAMGSGYLKGLVLAAGRGQKSKKGLLRPLDVQVGDEILFSDYVGTKIQFNSEDLIILNESDVMGIVQN